MTWNEYTSLNLTLIILGIFLILWAIGSVFFPKFLLGKALEQEFSEKGKSVKGYLFHQRMNVLSLGIVLIIALFVPGNIRKYAAFCGMAIVFASVLWCNKRHLGRFRAAKW